MCTYLRLFVGLILCSLSPDSVSVRFRVATMYLGLGGSGVSYERGSDPVVISSITSFETIMTKCLPVVIENLVFLFGLQSEMSNSLIKSSIIARSDHLKPTFLSRRIIVFPSMQRAFNILTKAAQLDSWPPYLFHKSLLTCTEKEFVGMSTVTAYSTLLSMLQSLPTADSDFGLTTMAREGLVESAVLRFSHLFADRLAHDICTGGGSFNPDKTLDRLIDAIHHNNEAEAGSGARCLVM